jgi:hypothetical protein
MAIKAFVVFMIGIMLACGGGGGGDEVDLSKQLNIPKHFTPRYSIHSVEDFSIPGAVRKAVKITVPKGLSRSELTLNLKHAVKSIYRNYQPDAISVVAYKSGTDHKGYYTAGKCDFAPGGDWGKAKHGTPVERLSTKIEINEMYFKKEEELLEIGSKVTLVETSGQVAISNRPDDWGDENIIIRVPVGTPATIIGHKRYSDINMIRYRVDFQYRGKNRIGWVHKWNISK